MRRRQMRKPHMRRRQNARSTIGRRASGLAGAAWAELRSEQELRALASEDVRHMTVATSPIASAWHNTRLELVQNDASCPGIASCSGQSCGQSYSHMKAVLNRIFD